MTNPYWRIGYATSPDGITWTKHANNPVIQKTESWEYANMMYPFVIFEDGKFKMWYGTGAGDWCTRYAYAESVNGYDWTKPADKNPVYSVPGTSGQFDRYRLSGLTLIRDENEDMYKVWYSGFNGYSWSVGYATTSADPITATPTPTPLEPVVIVPGLMASWNKEGILEGKSDPSTPWKLLPFVKEYDGLVETLKNLGYEEGKNLFLWPFDWRKPVETASQQLSHFIDSTVKPKNSGSKIQLVGHSLGGLVSRTWTQTGNNKDAVAHLVTVGSPAKGVVQPYKAWSGGDISQGNSFLSLASRIIIELHRRAYATTRQAIQAQFPGLKDLLPTDPYLRKASDGSLIPIAGMTIQNTWLSSLNGSVSGILPMTSIILGTGYGQTPNGYLVATPSWYDQVLGNWKDGKPVAEEHADGDSVVSSVRGTIDNSPILLSLSHGGLAASADGIKKILASLDIPATDADIETGDETVIQPGLLFLLRSPATLTVTHNGTVYTDIDGIIFIPDAEDGNYEATVTGTGSGTYRLAVGQFSGGSYEWKEYVGTTSNGKKTTYIIPFSESELTEDPASNLSDASRLDEVDLLLTELAGMSQNASVSRARTAVRTAKTALSKKDFPVLKKQLEQVLIELSAQRSGGAGEPVRLKTFAVADALIDAFQAIFSKQIRFIDLSAVSKLQTLCSNEETRINRALEILFLGGNGNALKSQLFIEGKTAKEKALGTSPEELAKKYILLFYSQILFREIRV